MSIANFIPTIWSRQLLITLRKNLVLTSLTNRNYQGEIGGVGSTLKIQTPAAITINEYTPRTTEVEYEEPTSTTQDLVIDQDFYFAFSVDDLEEVQSNVNLMSAFSNEAAYAMADKIDQDVASLYTEATHSTALSIASDTTGVSAAMIAAGIDLDGANVPSEGRWMAVSPTVSGALREVYGARLTQLGDVVVRKGHIGFIEGFNVYMSNNIAVATQHKCLYGTNAAMTYAFDIQDVEALRLEKAFEDALRGRTVWGRQVVRPEALGVLDVTVA